MAFDIVVINYHTDDLLADFVESYRKAAFEGCTLTIVDVDPLAPNQVLIAGVGGTARYFPTMGNVGYGKACNYGARMARTNDALLFCNADTLLCDRAELEGLYWHFISRQEWGVLGPRQVDDQNRITAGGIFGHPRSPAQRGWQDDDRGQYSDIREDALTVSGAIYAIKRRVWDELAACPTWRATEVGTEGAFLETPHYFEETCCSYHARAHGHKVVYYGATQMVHLWHKASVHGGWADMQFNTSQAMHREFCAAHGIECE